MSIINRMLKDLEQSGKSATEGGVYRPAKRRMPLWYALIVLLVPIALWAWWPMLKPMQSGHQTPIAANVPEVQSKTIEAPIPSEQLQSKMEKESPAPAAVEQTSSQVASETTPLENATPAESSPANEIVASSPALVSMNEPPAGFTPHQEPAARQKNTSAPDQTTEVANASPVMAEKMTPSNVEADVAPEEEVTPPPAAQLVIEEQKLSSGQIAAIERRKYQQAIQKRDLESAKQALRQVIANDPLDINSRQQLAALYFGENQLDAALQVLTQGIQQMPTNADLRLLAARVMQTKGQPTAALTFLTAISPSARNNIDFYAMRAALAQQTGANQEAISSYQALTVAEPTSGRWWVGLGIAYEKASQPDFAQSAYQHALDDHNLSTASKSFSAQRLQRLKGK